jgi:hypothetical protein
MNKAQRNITLNESEKKNERERKTIHLVSVCECVYEIVEKKVYKRVKGRKKRREKNEKEGRRKRENERQWQ